jgi:hypothetical protein
MSLFSKKEPSAPRRRIIDSNRESHRGDAEKMSQQGSFRRNRTLTGSASSDVASTNESKAQLKSPRVHAHDLVHHRRRLGVLFFTVLVCAAALFMLISQFTAGVVVRTQDVTVQVDSSYEEHIQDYLSRHPVERLKFFLNEAALDKFLQSAAPEVASVHISDSVRSFGTTEFTVTMRAPIAGWNVNGSQQYVDISGVSFAKNYFKTPAVQITDNTSIRVEAGQAVASNRFLGFVGLVVGLAKSQGGYVVTEVIIPAQTTREVQLKLKDIAFPVKFSVDRGAGEQVEDMKRSLGWLTAHGITPEYLDVRVSGKAFYK